MAYCCCLIIDFKSLSLDQLIDNSGGNDTIDGICAAIGVGAGVAWYFSLVISGGVAALAIAGVACAANTLFD
jgi:hypothetical protein